jgi:hypothetical protein
MAMPELTQSALKELLHYDPDTGVFRWAKKPSKNISVGSKAGSPHCKGYTAIGINKERHLAHRLAWLYVYGEMPSNVIDHINRDRSDNRITNLRPVTRSENQQNHKIFSNNTSGVSGVYWSKKDKKWHARIWAGKRAKSVGYFLTIEEAKAARTKAEREFYSLPS